LDYAKGDNATVSAANHNFAFPTTPSASRAMGARFAANRPEATGSHRQVQDCGLTTISGVPAFCMVQEVISQKKKAKHCWIKKPSQGNLKLTLTFDERHETSSVSDFEKMMASLKWQ
jgi:hypothetical protein